MREGRDSNPVRARCKAKIVYFLRNASSRIMKPTVKNLLLEKLVIKLGT
jgi:hypothetical protein